MAWIGALLVAGAAWRALRPGAWGALWLALGALGTVVLVEPAPAGTLAVGLAAWLPAALEAAGVRRIRWAPLAAVTVPAHCGLAVAAEQAWEILGPEGAISAVLWLHGCGLAVGLAGWRLWRGDELALLTLLVLDHVATLGLGALIWG